ncbi:MAG: SEL1-like repeat protein [Clostridia bacterium]|nr:SEL1-like repeat protein [Clostridia bacterium]
MEWWKYSGQKLCALADEVLNRRRASEDELHTAIEQLLEAERQHYMGALLRLGRCHEKGIGVPKEETAAMEYYRRAADRGNDAAEAETRRLNPLYRPRQLQETDIAQVPVEWGGMSVHMLCDAAEKEEDAEKRAQLLQFAIDMGGVRGMLLWAQELERREDAAGALLWYRRAALHGSAPAAERMKTLDALYDPELPDTDPLTGDQLYWLADDFRRGVGRPVNEAMFERLSAMASARNNGKAALELGATLYRKGEKERAVDFLKTASSEGFGAATDLLGQMTQQGEGGLAENCGEALRLFERAAAQNHGGGALHAGLCYEKGLGSEPDERRAAEWYLKAAKLGEKSAVAPMKKLAESLDDPMLKYHCGHWLLYDGAKNSNPDFKTAFQLLSAAADARIPEAYFDLGLMYRDGRYVYSKRKAVEYLDKAKQMGVSGAVPERKKIHRRTLAYLRGVIPALMIPVLVFAAVLFVTGKLEQLSLLRTDGWNAAVLWTVTGLASAGLLIKHYFIARQYSVRPFLQELLALLICPGAGVLAVVLMTIFGGWNLFGVALSMTLSAVLTVFLIQHDSAVRDALWVGLRLVCFVPGSILAAAVLVRLGVPMNPGWASGWAIAALTACVLLLIVKQFYLYSERLDLENFVVCGLLALLWPGVFVAGLAVFCWLIMDAWVLTIGMTVGTILHCIISEVIWGARESD